MYCLKIFNSTRNKVGHISLIPLWDKSERHVNCEKGTDLYKYLLQDKIIGSIIRKSATRQNYRINRIYNSEMVKHLSIYVKGILFSGATWMLLG